MILSAYNYGKPLVLLQEVANDCGGKITNSQFDFPWLPNGVMVRETWDFAALTKILSQ